jgi:hypothetical protein
LTIAATQRNVPGAARRRRRQRLLDDGPMIASFARITGHSQQSSERLAAQVPVPFTG